MNLTDIQAELRSIENRISALQVEIGKMKPRPEDERKEMFANITKLASQHPLKERKLLKADGMLARPYISCLSFIIQADESGIYDRLLYLCRLAWGMDYAVSAEEILQLGMETDRNYIGKVCQDLKDLKYELITDALILANIPKKVNDAVYSIIADIAGLMDCSKGELRTLGYVAKSVLMDDTGILEHMPVPDKNCWMGKMREFIPQSWIESQRRYCGKLYTTRRESTSRLWYNTFNISTQKSVYIKFRQNAGSIVKEGDVLVTFIRREVQNSVENKICAPCDGIVFFTEDQKDDGKNISVYVVSYFDEYADFCQWRKNIIEH